VLILLLVQFLTLHSSLWTSSSLEKKDLLLVFIPFANIFTLIINVMLPQFPIPLNDLDYKLSESDDRPSSVLFLYH